MTREDTIVAPATAAGRGGIGIIRVSGPDALRQLECFFRPYSKKDNYRSHTLYYGHFVQNNGQPLDEIMAVSMRSPHSYTTEDTVEFHCHNSVAIIRQIINTLVGNGVRLAEPGEFTQRAFLNGRLDLCQAEAVADLIAAKSERAGKIALEQLSGQLSKAISGYRSDIVRILALLETHIDFSEEDIDLPDLHALAADVKEIYASIKNLVNTFSTGRILHEGAKILILGAPNVGKSSLLNRFLGEKRAIVTDIPGTTRDSLEEQHQIGEIPVKLIDTAGIRETNDPIESEGISRALAKIDLSDLVLVMIDAGSGLTEQDHKLLEHCQNKKVILIFNKVDQTEFTLPSCIPGDIDRIAISCKTGHGMSELEDQISLSLKLNQESADESLLLYNARHQASLQNTLSRLDSFFHGAEVGLSPELLAVELRDAIQYLGEVTGESVTDELLDIIFSSFCIGK